MGKQRRERMEAFGVHPKLPALPTCILWYGLFSDFMAKL